MDEETLNKGFKQYIKTLYTKQLLKILRKHHVEFYYEGTWYDYKNNSLIYDELNTREHIPNKIEAKDIRKERAKYKRDGGKK